MIKNLRKSLMVDNDGIQESERAFSKALDVYKIERVSSPIDHFIKSFKLEKLKINTKDEKERVLQTFLLLAEMENLLKDETHSAEYITNLVNIFKGNDIKNFVVKLNFKPRFIKKIENENSFKLPLTHIMMHKKAKITRKHLFRKAFMVPTAFGQIKNLDTNKLFKSQKFQDQLVYFETKSQVIENIKKFKENKKKGIKEKKILKWVDNKEIKGMDYRVRFENVQKGFQRAIYYKDPNEAKNLKDNAIVQRIVVLDPNKASKVKVCLSIWKVKVAEYFYQHYLKNLITTRNGSVVINQENQRVTSLTKDFLLKNYPNLYDSGYDPSNVLNFNDNSYMKVKFDESKKTQKDINQANFATTIVPVILDEEDDLESHKRKIDLKSPFEQLNKEIPMNEILLVDFIDSFHCKQKSKSFNPEDTKKYEFIKNLAKNSILILNFNKIVIDNIFSHKDSHLDEDEINSLILKVETTIQQGNRWAESVTFAEENSTEFIAFDINSSFKVDLNNLKNISIKLTNKLTNDLLIDLKIDVQHLLDTFYLENMFHYGFDFTYKGAKMQGLLSFLLIVIPRNLEISHFILNEDFIKTNFESFKDIDRIEDYVDYQKIFLNKKYQKIKEREKCFEFFYFFNNFLPRIDMRVRHQENLILNSFKKGNFEEFSFLLKSVFKEKYTVKSFLTKSHENLNSNLKKGISATYDLIIKVLNLVSPKERLLLNRFIFDFKNKNYLNISQKENNFGFHALQITRITLETENYLKKYDYLHPDEKYLVFDLVYKIYMHFENNSFLGNRYSIYFSKHYIPMIIHFVSVNGAELVNKEILEMVTNQIINQNNMQNYSDTGALENLNASLVIFKIIFKKVYPNIYTKLMGFMISLDNFLCKCLLNSFADVFDSVSFNIFSDFKNLLFVLFSCQESNMGFIGKFQKLGISFFCLIDVLFVIETLVQQIHNFDQLNPFLFLKEITNSLKRSEINLKHIYSGIFKMLDFLFDQDFLYEDFSFLMNIISNKNKSKIGAYKNFALNVKSLKLQNTKLKGIILKEVIKNDIFKVRLKSLFKNSNSKNMETENEEGEEDFDVFNSLIEEDIFFEITEEFPEEMNDEELDVFEKKKLPKYESCVVYLNNLEQKLIESSLSKGFLKTDFNTILEFDFNETDNFIESVFGCTDVVRVEIYNDLCTILDTKKISLLDLIISFIITYTEDKYEISQLLEYLAKCLTHIFYEEKTEFLFDQVVAFILNEVYKFLPICYYHEFEKNIIENTNSTLFCYVYNAKLNIENYSIDVTQICSKHLLASTYLTKQSSIHLNSKFCKDLEALLSEMIEHNQLEPNFNRFEIFVDVYQQNKSHTVNLPFKISFSPEITVFCKVQNPIFFKKEINDVNLIPVQRIREEFLESPFCYFDVYSSLKTSLNFTNQDFCFRLFFKKLEFLILNIKFTFTEPNICTNLINWNFETQNPEQLIKMTQKELNIELPYTTFFLNFRQFYKFVTLAVVEVINQQDLFKFVQLNHANFSLNTVKNKDIDLDKHFYDLKEYETANKNKTKMEIIVKYCP
jgi:hypothetical protein